MDDLQGEHKLVQQHLNHHRIAIYGILIFLVILTFGVIIAFQSTESRPLAIPTQLASPTLAPGGEAAIAPESDYQNPFDKNTQYANPFSDNKNPFDNLK